MNTPITAATGLPSQQAQERILGMRCEPLFKTRWDRALMLHYAVTPEALQPFVPFPLDTYEGKAYVSLVSFTMRDLRPSRGGRATSLLLKPIATHEFLNIRTYVKHGGEAGIYFLGEWLPNRLSVALGRPFFGLPYQHGHFSCDHTHEYGHVRGLVQTAHSHGQLCYHATLPRERAPAIPGTLTEFLMERYTAFTRWMGWKRLFRVWHPPWQQCTAQAVISTDTLSPLTGLWCDSAIPAGAHYSDGFDEVWMSRPAFC